MSAPSRISPRPTTGTATFAVVGRAKTEPLARFVELVREALGRHADLEETDDGNVADLVINVVDESDPKPFRRRSRGTFVVGLYERDSHSLPEDYPMLVRALANIALATCPARARGSRRWSAATTATAPPRGRRRSPTRSSSGCSRSRAPAS